MKNAVAPAENLQHIQHLASMAAQMSASTYDLAVPPIRGTESTPAVLGSATNRVRHSSISSNISTINNPRRVRRRREPTPFNVLIIGASNSGKTSFVNFLRKSLAIPFHKFLPTVVGGNCPSGPTFPNRPFSSFLPHYLETEIDDERIALTIWDSEGLEANLVDLQLREISSFLESKFEETFDEERKVVRVPGFRDTHIHAAFLLLDPVHIELNIAVARRTMAKENGYGSRDSVRRPALIGGLDENFDLQVLRTLQDKTTVVPVIAKADTVTMANMARLKRAVWESLEGWNLYPHAALGLHDNSVSLKENNHPAAILQERKQSPSDLESPTDTNSTVDSNQTEGPGPAATAHGSNVATKISPPLSARPALPFCTISPDSYELHFPGRAFPWGFADPCNDNHCDFSRLKEMVFTEWRDELRGASKELWYERWRTSRLERHEHAMRFGSM